MLLERPLYRETGHRQKEILGNISSLRRCTHGLGERFAGREHHFHFVRRGKKSEGWV